MITQEKKQHIHQTLRRLVTSHAAAVADIEATLALLVSELGIEGFDSVRGEQDPTLQKPVHAFELDRPIADRATFTVNWRGRTCFLGNTLLFRLLERLLRSPNQYVAHVDLLDEVWDGQREASTIRGVAKRLRDRLASDGMEDCFRGPNPTGLLTQKSELAESERVLARVAPNDYMSRVACDESENSLIRLSCRKSLYCLRKRRNAESGNSRRCALTGLSAEIPQIGKAPWVERFATSREEST